MSRDEIIRDARARAGTFPAVLVVYGLIVATLSATGIAMT